MVTEMDGAPDVSSPQTEKVPWIAMKQGVFTTSDGKMIQAGASRIPADDGFHAIKFFAPFPSAPAVFVSNLDPVDSVLRDVCLTHGGAGEVGRGGPRVAGWLLA